MPRSRLCSTICVVSVDQVGAVVEGKDLDVLGQDLLVEFLGLGLDALQDILGLLAGAQQDDAFHRVVLLLVAELAQARRDADLHPADILDQHRRAVVHRQHDVADVLQRGRGGPGRARNRTGRPANRSRRRRCRCWPPARLSTCGTDRPTRGDLGRIEQHLVLHGAAAEAGIVGHAGNGFVLRARSTQSSKVLSSIGERSGLCST